MFYSKNNRRNAYKTDKIHFFLVSYVHLIYVCIKKPT